MTMIKNSLALCILGFISVSAFTQTGNAFNNSLINNPPDNGQLQVNNIDNLPVAMNTDKQIQFPQQAPAPQVLQQKQAVYVNTEAQSENQVFVINNSNKAYTSFAYAGTASKKHHHKKAINFHKIHILRKFRNECPLLRRSTYKKIFTSRKRKITRCFHF